MLCIALSLIIKASGLKHIHPHLRFDFGIQVICALDSKVRHSHQVIEEGSDHPWVRLHCNHWGVTASLIDLPELTVI